MHAQKNVDKSDWNKVARVMHFECFSLGFGSQECVACVEREMHYKDM